MEFNEKLQQLRKQKHLTQEELAEMLYVSRAAISKWESGRGYPSIDSLRMIAKFFGITIDELISGEAILTIAEETQKQKEKGFRSKVFALLDISTLLMFFLPFFAQKDDQLLRSVALTALVTTHPYLKILYTAFTVAIILCGILMLTIPKILPSFRTEKGNAVSFALCSAATLLFILSRQPYAAFFLFVNLSIKVILCIKER